jgi:enoyl-CoA hydratase/carnithine racemase
VSGSAGCQRWVSGSCRLPAVGVGFVPAAGGAYPLPRVTGERGPRLALTAVHAFAEPAPDGEPAGHRPSIDARCCGAAVRKDRGAVTGGAGGRGGADPAAGSAAELIGGHSPTALKATLPSLRRARELSSPVEAAGQTTGSRKVSTEASSSISGASAALNGPP